MGTEDDIFDSAVEGEDEDLDQDLAPPKGEVQDEDQPKDKLEAKEQAAPTPPKEERPSEAAPSAAQAKDQPPQPHQVPLTELLNTRERAQAAERERDELKRALERIAREQQAARQAEQQKPPELPDVFADPQAWQQGVLQTFEQRLAAEREQTRTQLLDSALEDAAQRHGQTFQEAFNSLVQTQDPALVQKLTANPFRAGDAIVNWHKQQVLIRDIGNDPTAYEAKVRDKLMNDEAFLAQIAEKLGAKAQPNGNRPQNTVRLPSLNRQTSAASLQADDDAGSEEAIWQAGNSRRRA